MKSKFYLTGIVLFLSFIVLNIYRMFQGAIESSIAVDQLCDNSFQYAIARNVAEGNIEKFFWFCVCMFLFFIWLPLIVKKIGEKNV